MNTNTNTTQTRQTSSTDTNSNDESNQETEITLPEEPERGPNGEYHCPADGCDWVGEHAMAGPPHHCYAHDTSFTADLFGEDRWREYLRQEHVEKGLRPPAIARQFNSYIGPARVRNDLEDFGLYFSVSKGTVTESAQILLHPDVETIADAQRVAAKRRGEL